MRESKKAQGRIRKRKWRENLTKNPPNYEKYAKNERLRKKHSRLSVAFQLNLQVALRQKYWQTRKVLP